MDTGVGWVDTDVVCFDEVIAKDGSGNITNDKIYFEVKTEESAARIEMLRRRSPSVVIVVPVTDSS